MIAVVLAMAVFAGVWILKAIRDDNLDAHLIHGPLDGCMECEDK